MYVLNLLNAKQAWDHLGMLLHKSVTVKAAVLEGRHKARLNPSSKDPPS